MNVSQYIIEAIFSGIKMFGLGILMICALALVMAALLYTPILAVEAFELGNYAMGTFWTLLTLFFYGVGYKSS